MTVVPFRTDLEVVRDWTMQLSADAARGSKCDANGANPNRERWVASASAIFWHR